MGTSHALIVANREIYSMKYEVEPWLMSIFRESDKRVFARKSSEAVGWYHSGDLGCMHAQGYVFLVDRAKDMIISGGENVYSTEVEEVLYKHPAVLEAAVFGVPDARWGEAVHAVVVPRPGHAVDAVSLMAFCREHIAGYKVPKQIDLRSDLLPKSGPGKVLKRELRAPFWAGRTAQIN